MLLLSILINFTLLVLFCYHIRQQGKFRTETKKQVQECLSLLIKIERKQLKPNQGCMEFTMSGNSLKRAFDNSIPPRI